ncbi:MAG: hypothetical protein C0514_09125, partial [Candidatus Puniceispirillum sp.]|nr:hypothetical protein [Candidatus Puniceispirillum sp.]
MTSPKAIFKRCVTYILVFNLITTQVLQAARPLHIDIVREHFDDHDRRSFSLRINDQTFNYQTNKGTYKDTLLHEGKAYTLSVKPTDLYKQAKEATYQVLIKSVAGGFDLNLQIAKDGIVKVDFAKTLSEFRLSTFGSLQLAPKSHHIAAAHFTAKSIYNYGRCHVSHSLGLKRFEGDGALTQEPLFRNAGDAHLYCQGKIDVWGGDFENQREFTATGDLDVSLNGNAFIHTKTTNHLSRLNIQTKMSVVGASQVLLRAPVEGDNATLNVQSDYVEADIASPSKKEAHKRSRGLVVENIDFKAKRALISPQTTVTAKAASMSYAGQSAQDFRESALHLDGDILCRENFHVSVGRSVVGKKGKLHAASVGVFGNIFENHGQVTGKSAGFHLKELFNNYGALGMQSNLFVTSDHRLFNSARAHLYGSHVSLISHPFQNDGLILSRHGSLIQKILIQSSGAFLNSGEIEAGHVHGIFERKQSSTKATHFKNIGKILAKDRMILDGDAIGCNENLIKSRFLTLRGDLHIVNGKSMLKEEDKNGCIRAQKTHFALKGSFTNTGDFDSHKVTGFAHKFNNLGGKSLVGNWQLHASTFKNAGAVLGAGFLRAANFKNVGLMKGDLTLHIGSKAENKGVLEILSLIGEGHFLNFKRMSVSRLNIASYVESGLLISDQVTLGKDAKRFETSPTGHLKITRLLAESGQDQDNAFIHKGKANIQQAHLKGNVLLAESSTWSGRALSWVGSLFHIKKLASLKGVKDLSLEGETKNDAKLLLKDANVFFSDLKNDHKLEVSGQTHLKAYSVSNSAQISVSQGAKVHIAELHNDKAITFKGADVRVDSLKNTGFIHAQGCGPFRILQGGNEGTLSLDKTHAQLGLNAHSYLSNRDTILVGEGAKATLENVDNEGLVRYTAQSAIDHFFLAHALGRKIGRLESAHLLTLNADGKNLTPFWQYVNTRLIQADLEVNAVHMVLRDAFTHALSLTLRSSHFENFSDVGAHNLSVFARCTENNGRMRAKENLTLQNVSSLGRVYAGEKLEVNGSSRDIVLQSQHLIEGAKTVTMTLGAALKIYQNLTIENVFRVIGSRFFNYAHLKAGEIYADVRGDFSHGRQGAMGILESTKEGITLLCYDAWNLYGEILSRGKLTVRARGSIISGESVATTLPVSSRPYGGAFYKSNGALMFSAQDMELTAGADFLNDFGTVLCLANLNLTMGREGLNQAGFFYVGQDARLNGAIFENSRLPSHMLLSENSEFNGKGSPVYRCQQDDATGEITSRYIVRHVKHNYPSQHFIKSGPARIYVGNDLHLSSGMHFINKASDLHVGGLAPAPGARLSHIQEDIRHTYFYDGGKNWPYVDVRVQELDAFFSITKGLCLDIDSLETSGIISAPHIKGVIGKSLVIQGRTHPSMASSSSSGILAHLEPFMATYTPYSAVTSQSTGTSLIAFGTTHPSTSLTVGRTRDPDVTYEKARKAMTALVHMRDRGFQGEEGAPFCGPLPESYLTPLCRGALPEGFERFALPQSHPGYLFGLRFLTEYIDPNINAAILCTGGTQEGHLRSLFKNHVVVNAAQPFLEYLWYLDTLSPMNTGYLIGGITTHEEIALLKEVGLRFAMNKGRREILSVHEEEMDMCPFPMITYKPLYTDGFYVLKPHLYVPASFWEDPVAVTRRMGQAGLIADDHIQLLTGTFDCSGVIAAGGDVDLQAQGDGRVSALASRQGTNHGFEETRAPGSGTIMSFHGAVRVSAGNTLQLESAKFDAHKEVVAQGKKGTYVQTISLTAEETHGSKKNKTTVRTSTQIPSEFTSKTAQVEVSSPEGDVLDVGSYFTSPVLVKLYGKKGVNLLARRLTKEHTHSKQSGCGPMSSISQHVTQTSAPMGSTFDAPAVHVASQDPDSQVLLESTDLSKPQNITLETPVVALTSAAHETVEQYAESSKSVVVNTVCVGGSSRVSYVPPRLGVMPELKAPEGSNASPQVHLSVPQECLQDKQSILARLAATRGAVVESLKQEALTWEKTTTRLGSGVMVALGICLSMMTGGAGGSWAVAALQAADISLTLQFLDGLVANKGNPAKALQETFSAQGLKSVAGAALTAGVSSSLGGVFGKVPVKGSLDLGEHFAYNLRLSLAKIPTQAVFEGKGVKEILSDAALGAVSGTVSTLGAAHIGALVHPLDGAPSALDPITHKVLHAAVGAAAAAVARKDIAAGALGAAVGECVGEICRDTLQGDPATGGRTYEEVMELTVGISGIVSAMTASLLDLDADTAANAAQNAVERNVFFLAAVPPLIEGAVIALNAAGLTFMAYDFVEAYHRGGLEAAY